MGIIVATVITTIIHKGDNKIFSKQDTYMKENFIREELIDLCIKYGMPITGNEDMETLEAYLNMAYEEDRLNQDIFEDEIFDVAEKAQQKKNPLNFRGF